MKITVEGTQVNSFRPNDDNLRDLAWDGVHIWMINSGGTIKKFTTDGVFVDSIVGLLTGGWGLTYGNGCLWASDPNTNTIYQISLTVGVEDENVVSLAGPSAFWLSQSYPNPFRLVTLINYRLPKDAHVRLEIYNPLGQKITTLVNERQTPGDKVVYWNASSVASGIYFYRMEVGSFTTTRKVTLLK